MNKPSIQRLVALALVMAVLVAGLGPAAALAGPHSQTEPVYLRLKYTTFDPQQSSPDIPDDLRVDAYSGDGSGAYIVQFRGPVEETWKEQVRDLGADILDYLPDYAFLLWMDATTRARVAELDSVRWIGIYQPAYKISPSLGETEVLRVQLAPGADLTTMDKAAAAIDGTVVERDNLSWTVHLAPNQVPALAHLPAVLWIEAEPELKLYNNIARRGGGGMDAYAMWNLGVFGAGQIAAVADSGLDTNNASTVHRDFRGRVVHISQLGTVSTDTNGHGTHVAGSVVGNGTESGTNAAAHDYGQLDTADPNQATAKVTGIAPEAQLYFQSVLCDYPLPGLCGLPNDLNQLFLPAYEAGARVHSNSWGADTNGMYEESSQDADEFTWNHPEMLITAAAGNAGTDAAYPVDGWVNERSIGSPAVAKNVLAVGATENARTNGGVNAESPANDLDEVQCFGGGTTWGTCFDGFPLPPTGPDPIGGTGNAGQMAAFSSRGPAQDGRIKPDVVAPGTSILSTMSSQVGSCGWGYGELGDKYCMNGGTSMANPLTAGAAVLVRDWYQDVKGHANPSGALLKATLINTAVDIAGYGDPAHEAGQPIPNNHEGWGMVNLANVAADGRQFHDGDAVSTGGSQTYNLQIGSRARPFKVSLVWSDHHAALPAWPALVNDLNLVVEGPGGVTYHGNAFSGGWSTTGGAADAVNNVENVYVQKPPTGNWTVRVEGANVPYGPQPFALVLSGQFGAPPVYGWHVYLPLAVR